MVKKNQDGINRFGVVNKQFRTIKHSKLYEYKCSIPSENFDKLFKFSVIRNPWDRMISNFFHQRTRRWDRNEFVKHVKTRLTLRDFIVQPPTLFEKVAGFMGEKFEYASLISEIDYLIKFEELDEGFKYVCERIGIPFTPLPNLNTSKRNAYREYYDENLIALVSKKFREEIEYGQYKF